MKNYKKIQRNGKIMKFHRYVMEKHIGRKLKPNEVVHHINGDHRDNRIENLEIMDYREHLSLHGAGSKRKRHTVTFPMEL